MTAIPREAGEPSKLAEAMPDSHGDWNPGAVEPHHRPYPPFRARPRLTVKVAGTHEEEKHGRDSTRLEQSPRFLIVNRNKYDWEGVRMTIRAAPLEGDAFEVPWHEETVRDGYGLVDHIVRVGVGASLMGGVLASAGGAKPEIGGTLTIHAKESIAFHIADGILAPRIPKGSDYYLEVTLMDGGKRPVGGELDRTFTFRIDAKEQRPHRA
ncbi:MAG: hypothetical protein ABR586_03410 [Thermoplasmatota archaeon]